MTALTRQLIREFRVQEAFWTTAETVAYDSGMMSVSGAESHL